jgi:hypothetical protein
VVTHSAKAEYGRSSGGQVEMVSRSGGNRWSGALLEFHRNTALNANDFFNNKEGIDRPELKHHTFGGLLGGPLLRDRMFLFAGYQGGRVRQQLVRTRVVATPEAKSGIFRWRVPVSGDIRSFDIARNDPRGNGIDPVIAETLKLLPEPNTFDTGDQLNTAGFRFNNRADIDTDSGILRVDHNLAAAARLFFRYTPFSANIVDINGDAPFPGQPNGRLEPASRAPFAAGFSWTVSPTMVNDFRVARNDVRIRLNRPQRLPAPMVTSTLWTNPLRVIFPQEDAIATTELTDHMSAVRGSHTLKIGINVRLYSLFRESFDGVYPNVSLVPVGSNPPPSFGPSGATVISTADRARFEQLYNHLLGHIGTVHRGSTVI